MAIIDVGRKGVGGEWGPPRIKNMPGAEVVKFGSEEHIGIALPDGQPVRVGDQIEIIPSHGCTTCNLYREYVVHRNGTVMDIWPIEGSGKLR
jgi:D-serine deaminase-like pyridoxal phosphate-dependent protein